MTNIRIGDARNIPAIMPIMDEAFDPSFGEAWTASQCMAALALPYCNLLLAESGGRIIGFAISRWVLDEEELLMIGVAPSHRRKKIGSKLIGHMIENARDSGRKELFLEVRDGNEAVRFYSRHGFSEIGRRKEYYTGVENIKSDAITMRRPIDLPK